MKTKNDDEIEGIDLAKELMIPTERKEPGEAGNITRDEDPEDEEEDDDDAAGTHKNDDEDQGKDDDKVKLSEVISPEDSAQYLVDGVDALLSIAGGTVYAIKGFNILTTEQKKVVVEARRKRADLRSDDEKHLIAFLEEQKQRLSEKSDAVELTEKERAKLEKSSRAMVKVKGWKIGPEFAFYVVLADILSDRMIDMFMDD